MQEKDYLTLLGERDQIFIDLNRKNDEIHKSFLAKHKKFIKFLDVLIILAVISNIGALIITHILVVKNEPTKEFYEGNPVSAGVHNFETTKDTMGNPTPEGKIKYTGFIFTGAAWTFIIVAYIYFRRTLKTNTDLYILIGSVLWVAILSTTDVAGDLGYLIGKLIFGG